MNKGKYVFSQVMDFLPLYEFNQCVKHNKANHRVRELSCWDQFLALSFGQLCFRNSLRDIISCLEAHKSKYYHLGFSTSPSRSTLAEANEKRPWKTYQDFAQILIKQARKLYQEDSDFLLELDNTVYAFDSTTIDLCRNVFPWAGFRKNKSGVKLHTQMDLRGNLPTFISITEARTNDVHGLDDLEFEPGAFYVMDRAYTDTVRLYDLHLSKAFFVVRAKDNIKWKRLYSRPVDKSVGLRCDQTIRFTGISSRGGYPETLRRIKYYDQENKRFYVFWTNHFSLDPKLITDLYKERWKIELFFKWMKQHLEIKSFWGTSKNAVHIQIWIAVCTYLLIAILKKKLALDKSIYEILQILNVSLFDKTPLSSLLSRSDSTIKSDNLQQTLF